MNLFYFFVLINTSVNIWKESFELESLPKIVNFSLNVIFFSISLVPTIIFMREFLYKPISMTKLIFHNTKLFLFNINTDLIFKNCRKDIFNNIKHVLSRSKTIDLSDKKVHLLKCGENGNYEKTNFDAKNIIW